METGMRIGQYLTDNGIKQTFITENTGLPAVVVSAMVNGKRKIRVDEYYKICKALNVPLETFLEEGA